MKFFNILFVVMVIVMMSGFASASPVLTGLVVGDSPIVWSDWLDRDDTGGNGDYETLVDFLKLSPSVVPCTTPVAIECMAVKGTNSGVYNYPKTTKSDSAVSYAATGEVVYCETAKGAWCVNAQQPDGVCNYDYIVRFGCSSTLPATISNSSNSSNSTPITPPVVYPCVDGDGGNNVAIKSSVTYKDYVVTDACVGENNVNTEKLLNEAICDAGGVPNMILVTCSGVCRNDICVSAPATCSDSDSQSSTPYYFAGTAYGTSVNGDAWTKSDYCSGTSVVEYGCNGGESKSTTFSCPFGCKNGACVNVNATNVTLAKNCVESDNGDDIYNAGRTSGFNSNMAYVQKDDACATSKTLTEYYCSENLVRETNISCPYGCSVNVCVNQAETVCEDDETEVKVSKGTITTFTYGGVEYKFNLLAVASDLESEVLEVISDHDGVQTKTLFADNEDYVMMSDLPLRVYDLYRSSSESSTILCVGPAEEDQFCADGELKVYPSESEEVKFEYNSHEYSFLVGSGDEESEIIRLKVYKEGVFVSTYVLEKGVTKSVSGLDVDLFEIYHDSTSNTDSYTAGLCLPDGAELKNNATEEEPEDDGNCASNEERVYLEENSPVVYTSGGIEYKFVVISGNAQKSSVELKVVTSDSKTKVENMAEGNSRDFFGVGAELNEVIFDSAKNKFTAEICLNPNVVNSEDEVAEDTTEKLEDCNGCLLEGKCLTYGFRSSAGFCSTDAGWQSFKGNAENCLNNFECGSNLCLDGQCVEQGFFKKLSLLLKKWF